MNHVFNDLVTLIIHKLDIQYTEEYFVSFQTGVEFFANFYHRLLSDPWNFSMLTYEQL